MWVFIKNQIQQGTHLEIKTRVDYTEEDLWNLDLINARKEDILN